MHLINQLESRQSFHRFPLLEQLFIRIPTHPVMPYNLHFIAFRLQSRIGIIASSHRTHLRLRAHRRHSHGIHPSHRLHIRVIVRLIRSFNDQFVQSTQSKKGDKVPTQRRNVRTIKGLQHHIPLDEWTKRFRHGKGQPDQQEAGKKGVDPHHEPDVGNIRSGVALHHRHHVIHIIHRLGARLLLFHLHRGQTLVHHVLSTLRKRSGRNPIGNGTHTFTTTDGLRVLDTVSLLQFWLGFHQSSHRLLQQTPEEYDTKNRDQHECTDSRIEHHLVLGRCVYHSWNAVCHDETCKY